MGGMGSGRRGHGDVKDTTADYRAIDVRCWHRDALLGPHQTFVWRWLRCGQVVGSIHVQTEPDQVIVSYSHQGGASHRVERSYPIHLEWTECHLGGQRPWFRCPARGCGRRVAILYGGHMFACRRCYNLAYPSQREAQHDRAARRADKIRKRLRWEPGILNGKGSKPVGMHWHTFCRLIAEHDALVAQSVAGMAQQLGLPRERLGLID